MNTIDVTTPYLIGDFKIAKINISPLFFAGFAECASKASSAVATGQRFETALQRERMIKQCSLLDTQGGTHALDAITCMSIPLAIAKRILDALTDAEGVPGTIIGDGDGISKPIHYKFGTPIKGADGKTIDEIEIIAKVYGDVEDVLAETSTVRQTILLLEKVAKPIGMLALPSWAVGEITMADGVNIANKILPRFLE